MYPHILRSLCPHEVDTYPFFEDEDSEVHLQELGPLVSGHWKPDQLLSTHVLHHRYSAAQSWTTLRPPWTAACQASLSFTIS